MPGSSTRNLDKELRDYLAEKYLSG
jgi:hypothetical protein